MLAVVGLPLFFLELTLGQYSGSGPLKVVTTAGRRRSRSRNRRRNRRTSRRRSTG